MGFCLYNNVAIAASYLLNERQELGINKILIVDWDVHHGNGTQNMFYKDPRVLVFSVHRHDFGTFYPSGNGGSYIMTGEGEGAGHNINVPWEHGQCGDADYLAVWDHILIPVAKEFKPDIIIISAGFDAAKGDPLGECCVSPNGYSVMLHKLMEFAGGKIVMALEGGYNLNSTASSALACVEALLHNKPPNVVSEARPFASTWRVIQQVCGVLRPYWPVLARIDNNHPTESDPVTSPHVPEKGLLRPCNMSSIKKSTGGEADSLQTLAGDIGSGAGADKPANFPRPLRDLTGAECQAQMEAQIASSGLKEMDDMDPEKFADALCYAAKVERARARKLAAVRRLRSVAAALKAKAAELMTALEEDPLAAQETAAQLKAERDYLNTELERVNAAKAEELEAAKQALTQAFSTRFQKAKTRWLAEKENAYILGMKECRSQFFLTARGHQFLRIMLDDTLEAFCRTPESLDVLGPGMGHLINDVCTLLMDQIGATPEQRALYDFHQIVDSVDAEGLDRVLGIDSEAPRTPAWWVPVVDKALKQFVEEICADALPTSPLLRTPYLDRLQAAATRLNAEAAAGEPLFYPRPPAGAMTGAAAMELQASATHES
ncbi:histone deacetylase 18-like isoform X2 [Salvia miltiorrhiza]|nr:histone deacetylase 18-like isoform X2 [Salvia miltiorrhiza]